MKDKLATEAGREFQEDVRIDAQSLDVEWLEQAERAFKWNKRLADAKRELDRVKTEVDIDMADFRMEVRRNPSKYGIEKVSVDAIENCLTCDVTWKRGREELAEAQHEVDILFAAVMAMNQRRDALENLVRLFGQNYFAGPSAPRDLSREAMESRGRQMSKDRIRGAMNTSESGRRRRE